MLGSAHEHEPTCASLNGGMYAPPAGPAFKAGRSLAGSATGATAGAASAGLRCFVCDESRPRSLSEPLPESLWDLLSLPSGLLQQNRDAEQVQPHVGATQSYNSDPHLLDLRPGLRLSCLRFLLSKYASQ